MTKPYPVLIALVLGSFLMIACSGTSNSRIARQCSNDIDVAYRELDLASSKGFSGTVAWTKAASLLSAAKIQYEFEKYPNCIDKVRRARSYIEQSKRE